MLYRWLFREISTKLLKLSILSHKESFFVGNPINGDFNIKNRWQTSLSVWFSHRLNWLLMRSARNPESNVPSFFSFVEKTNWKIYYFTLWKSHDTLTKNWKKVVTNSEERTKLQWIDVTLPCIFDNLKLFKQIVVVGWLRDNVFSYPIRHRQNLAMQPEFDIVQSESLLHFVSTGGLNVRINNLHRAPN